jgi:hypothetical protein
MVNFKAGKYYVGDPCYVISDEHWDELGEQTNWFQNNDSFKFKGNTCFTCGTAYGDGTYYDYEGREYGVDAGLIGVVPFKCIDDNFKGEGGQIIEFNEDFQAYEQDGTFFIGDITIETGDLDEESEWEDEKDNDDSEDKE